VNVHRGSPADEMGIRNGDRITQVNGRQVESTDEFISMIRNMDPGEQVELDIRRARGGGERTVRGELESRAEALAERGQGEWFNEPGERSSSADEGSRFGQGQRFAQRQDEPNWQTSYEDEQRGTIQGGRSGQVSSTRIEQLQRQVDRLSQQIDDLRVALQDLRRQGGQQRSREQTARYDEYETRAAEGPRRSGEYNSGQRTQRSGQFEGQRTPRATGQYEDTDQSRRSSSGRTYESRRIDPDQGETGDRPSDQAQSDRARSDDAEPDSPGGEIGEDRQHVGTEDLNE
jgi:hypothetical protein